MTPEEVARGLRRDFSYVLDPGKDKWTWGPLDGPFFGDCDDFALTAAVRHYGSIERAWQAFESGAAKMHFVRSPNGAGHAVLEIIEVGFIDNMDPFWRPTMNGRYAYKPVKVYSPKRIREKIEGKSGKGKLGMVLVAVLVIGGAVAASQAGLF